VGLAITVAVYPVVDSGELLRYRVDWLPAAGLYFSLRMDGLAWLFITLIQGITLLVVLYARYYMSPKDPVARFFSFLLAFMGAMVGIGLSGNLIQLVMFWELTSLTSFLLISYWHHSPDARRGARMALTVTATGGLCLLVGVLLVGHIVGSYELDDVLAAGDRIREHAWYVPTLILIALGALTKSAQFPFHFWLPHAMAAPTPVSAYLHSATMVKAGIFLLIRLWPVLSGTPEWTWIIAGAGMCTMLVGSFMSIYQHDLKGLLAYSTISHLGLITLLLGIGSPFAMVAAIFHTLNHATFKASLFMAAGIIDHETGTRDMRKLRGLMYSMPITATLAIIASAAMAGVPLLNGFLSKEMFFSEAIEWGTNGSWMSIVAVIFGIFSVAYSLRFIYVFFGSPAQDLPRTPHEPPRWMRFPVEFLVFCCLIVGVAPGLSIGPLLHLAVDAVLAERTPEYSLAVWHGFNIPLLMSTLALLLGVIFYKLLRRYGNLIERDKVPLLHRFSGKQAYESVLLGLSSGASKLEKLLSTRNIQPQLLVIILLVLGLGIVTWPEFIQLNFALPDENPEPLFVFAWIIGCACAVVAAWQAKYHRLAALALVGGTGIVTCLTFLWLSAPDLALTQLMVETVTTILILLGLRWLPPRLPPRYLNMIVPSRVWIRRSRDLVIAVVAGVGMAGLSYGVMTSSVHNTISSFFTARALSEGGGSNVVNVLLVDFRGFDTFGEITVLAIVALTVYALLRRFRPDAESIKLPPQQTHPVDAASRQTAEQQASEGYLFVPSVYLRLLSPIICLVAIYLFMRGHNLPGGGFVAGLTFSIAIILHYMLAGTLWVESRLHLHPHRWIMAGLGVACL